MGASLNLPVRRAAVPHNAATKGILLTIVAMAGFATMDGISKHLVGTYAIHQILWIRYVLFALFAVFVARQHGVRHTAATPHRRLQITRALLLVVEAGTFVLAFKFLPLADTHAIAASAPLMVTVLATVFLGERVGLRRWSATLVGFLGVLLIIRPGPGVFDPSAVIPVVGAALFAIYQALTRFLRRDSAETTLLYSGVTGLAALTLVAPFGWQWPTPGDWAFLLILGALGTTAHWLLILALRAAPASLIQPYTYTLVLFATGVGFIGFGDIPDSVTVLGGAVVIGSGLYTLHRESLKKAVRQSA